MNEKEKLKVLSLFAGIGGIDLGLESTGRFETIQFVEYEPFCQHILRRHWPDVPIWGDVKTFDPDSCGDIDLLCGGYPCQPFSVAGKQKGTEDDRHLWPRMFEIIKHKRPTWVLCENVPGHVNLGLDQVLFDLESEGYSWQTFVLGAVAVDAPHRRQRLFIVANTNNNGHKEGFSETRNQNDDGENTQSERTTNTKVIKRHSNDGNDKETTRVDGAISRSSDGGEAVLTTTEGICSVSEGTDKHQGTNRENNHQENNDRTLVSQGSKRVQLPKYRKLEDNKTLSKSSKIQQGDDNSRKHRMDNETTDVADTQDIGHVLSAHEGKQARRSARCGEGQSEGNSSDVPNTNVEGLEGQRIDRENGEGQKTTDNFDGESSTRDVSEPISKRGCSGQPGTQDAADVGEQPRGKEHGEGSIERGLGGMVDGVPSWLHEPDIPRVTTNQVGRTQRLKALGNAVVPQVIAQIARAIIIEEDR